jgi:hypothetical protein
MDGGWRRLVVNARDGRRCVEIVEVKYPDDWIRVWDGEMGGAGCRSLKADPLRWFSSSKVV